MLPRTLRQVCLGVDHLRADAIEAEVAKLNAERDGIDRRLSQIERELVSA